MNTRDAMTRSHLDEVAEEIWSGRCVAFVGAGFSAAARLLGWEALLDAVAGRIPAGADNHALIRASLDRGQLGHRELETVAQLIQDALGPDGLREALADELALDDADLGDVYRKRRSDLRQIPFRAILTTNFDPLLRGELPSPAAYRRLLREDWGGPWDARYWPSARGEDAPGPEVYQLHGRVGTDTLVFARRDYRAHLFANPGYLTFLKALFATRTVLFLGFSFRDAYLDLLRAELLELVEAGGDDPPVLSYAILADVSEAEMIYARKHEGLRTLGYDATGGDHSAFDRMLDTLARRTNPVRRLATRLAGASVLWFDPHPDNNALATRLLRSGATRPFFQVADFEQAQRDLATTEWDLVITHWGHRPGAPSNAQRLLEWMHAHRVRSPVVVFCEPEWAAHNRRTALRWGAADLASDWVELFRAVDRVLGAASEG